MIQAVIFNLEHTVLDPGGRGLMQGMRDIFRWKGLNVTEDQVAHGRGLPIRDHIASVLGLSEVRMKWMGCFGNTPGRQEIEHLYTELVPVLRSLLQAAEPVAGMEKALQDIHERRIQSGATASYPLDMIRAAASPAMGTYGLDCTVTSCEVNQGRPYPWMIYEIAQQLQVFPLSDIVKVGDTPADMQEGRNAGVWTIGVLSNPSYQLKSLSSAVWGMHDQVPSDDQFRQEAYVLKKAGAHIVIESMSELPNVLREIEMLQHTGAHPSSLKHRQVVTMPPPFT